LSISSENRFDSWLKAAFQETGGFTALILLVEIKQPRVKSVSSTYVHIIGDELSWPEFSDLLHKARVKWDGVAIFIETANEGGPVADFIAKVKLRDWESKVFDDPLHINEGHFFDPWGRRMKVDETELPKLQ
jgi:hypothetical protein